MLKKILTSSLLILAAGCGGRQDPHQEAHLAANQTKPAKVRLFPVKRLKNPQLEALREFVMTDSIWYHDAWGRFGNCHYQNAYSYSGETPNIEEVARRSIYGKRGISYEDFIRQNSIQNMKSVRPDQRGVAKMYQAMLAHTLPVESSLDDSVLIAKKLKALTLSAVSPALDLFTAKEKWGQDDEADFDVAIFIDQQNHQSLVVASGHCDFPQPPFEG